MLSSTQCYVRCKRPADGCAPQRLIIGGDIDEPPSGEGAGAALHAAGGGIGAARSVAAGARARPHSVRSDPGTVALAAECASRVPPRRVLRVSRCWGASQAHPRAPAIPGIPEDDVNELRPEGTASASAIASLDGAASAEVSHTSGPASGRPASAPPRRPGSAPPKDAPPSEGRSALSGRATELGAGGGGELECANKDGSLWVGGGEQDELARLAALRAEVAAGAFGVRAFPPEIEIEIRLPDKTSDTCPRAGE
jgi:hypothetical protein